MSVVAPSNLYRAARRIAAVLLVAVAVLHVVQAFAPNEPTVRHSVLVGVNTGLAALLVWRQGKWAFWPALVLSGQQMYSHGLDLSRSFTGAAPLDWASLAVCLFFPTIATILFIERGEEDEEADQVTGI
jgi:hypothetical protein